MIPTTQTDLTPENGNCFAACIASILEVPLAALPNYHGQNGAWFNDWNQFLEPFNLALMQFMVGCGMCDNEEEHPPEWPVHPNRFCIYPLGYSILGAKSPRHTCLHAVVLYNGQIVHDPHPNSDMGVGQWEDCTLILVRDQSRPADLDGIRALAQEEV